MQDLPSPKQPQPERLKDWYPYYAGFSREFALATISKYMPDADSILDPWNGSGTTTAAAAELGLRGIGVDINPALGVIARARLVPSSIAESLVPVGIEITDQSHRERPTERFEEPLATWFAPSSVSHIRRLQRAIHTVTAEDDELERDLAHGTLHSLQTLPLVTAFFYAALFAATRDLLRSFRGSNPTWIRYPATYRHRLRPDEATVANSFIARARYLAQRLRLDGSDIAPIPTLITGRAEKLSDTGDDEYGGCLTSPPYATRIDYIRGSLPELSVLGVGSSNVRRLRELSAGTPVVRGERADRELPPIAIQLVNAVAKHPSHGSANYYAPWLTKYFGQLDAGIEQIARRVRPGQPIGLVIQDSYYKAIRLDLQSLAIECFDRQGRYCLERHDFRVAHAMSNINTKARKHVMNRQNTETLLVFT